MYKVALVVIALSLTASARAEMEVIETPPPPQFPAPPPGPPPQVAALASQLAGTWACTSGESMTIAIEVAGGWLRIASAREIELRSYDIVAKQWTRVVLDADGGHRTQTSLGDVRGTWTWTGAGATASELFSADALVRGDVTCRRQATPTAARTR